VQTIKKMSGPLAHFTDNLEDVFYIHQQANLLAETNHSLVSILPPNFTWEALFLSRNKSLCQSVDKQNKRS